jgi:dUTP pyrophosphatase
MDSIEIKIRTLDHFDPTFDLPRYETSGAAGLDIRACFKDKQSFILPAGERALIPTGLSLEIPHGLEVQVRPRSGLSLKTPLIIPNSPGTIDSDYRGEVGIIMANIGKDDFAIEHGMRVAQLVVAQVISANLVLVKNLSETTRGAQGFGSTGQLN